jgi:large conductance mechanosensitive channel
MNGFRKFVLRGNLIDLGLAVVVGVAFNTLVQALIRDLTTPLFAAAGGQPDFSRLAFHFNNSTFFYGSFINAVVSFAVIVAVVYFAVVAPAGRLAKLAESRKEATERPCPECLSEIPAAAARCRFCTAVVRPAAKDRPGSRAPASTWHGRLTWRPRN